MRIRGQVMSRPLLASALVLVLSLVASCDRAPTEKPPSKAAAMPDAPRETTPKVGEHKAVTTDKLEPYVCGTITRLHTLGGVFLASQPKPEDFAQAKKSGVKTVINLRHAVEIKDFDEQKVVEAEGLTYVNVPWDGPEELTDAVFDKAREQLKTAQRPILLHCGSANRVGAVWLPFRVLDGGLTWDEALAEAKTVGLKSPDYEAKAKDYVQRHGK